MSTLSLSPTSSPAPSPHPAWSPRPGSAFPSRPNARLSPRFPAFAASTTAPAPAPATAAAQRSAYAPPSHGSPPPPTASPWLARNERDVPPPHRARYVDSATQYSPECEPPTAGKVAVAELAPAKGKDNPITTTATPSAGRKRKDVASPSADRSPPASMSAPPAVTAGAGADPDAPHPISNPRNEPDLRKNPTTSDNAPASLTTAAAAAAEPAIQEARSTHGHSAAPKRSRPDPATVRVMPTQYETCNPKELGGLISNMLLELIRINDKIPLRDGRLTRFHSRAAPGISVYDYLQRLIQHATLSPPILLSMVYYIDRLCTLYTAFTINSLTVHRFLITAACVAAKGLSDSFWTNPTYARIGGIPVSELATLELELLQRVDWKIVPKPEVLEEYYCSLVERTEGYTLEGSSSGSEISSLDEDVKMGEGGT